MPKLTTSQKKRRKLECVTGNNLTEPRALMEKSLEFLSDQIVGIRHGLITMAVIDSVRVKYYGQMMPIKHLAETARQDHRIGVTPHDPNAKAAIEKALKAVGFEAYTFSKTQVVVSVPPPSGEDRQKVVARLEKLAEETRIAVRSIRKNFRNRLKKDWPPSRLVIGEDEVRNIEKDLQTMTDRYIREIDTMIGGKIEACRR